MPVLKWPMCSLVYQERQVNTCFAWHLGRPDHFVFYFVYTLSTFASWYQTQKRFSSSLNVDMVSAAGNVLLHHVDYCVIRKLLLWLAFTPCERLCPTLLFPFHQWWLMHQLIH